MKNHILIVIAVLFLSGCAGTKLMKNCQLIGKDGAGDSVHECGWY